MNSPLSRPLLIGAAGFGLGVMAAASRKVVMQAPSVAAGDWTRALAAEHRMVEALFEATLKTTSKQAGRRKAAILKIGYALTKHGLSEENAVYPLLMHGEHKDIAQRLYGDHGEIKTFVHDLKLEPADSPEWLGKLEAFRDLVVEHAREEEEEIFPELKARMSPRENGKLTLLANYEALKVA